MKQGTIAVEVGKPLSFSNAVESDRPPDSAELAAMRIRDALVAYSRTAQELLKDRYSSYAHLVPRHLREKCNITVLRCTDGVLVRFDLPPDGKPAARSAKIDKPLSEVVPAFSDRIIHFDQKQFNPETDGFRFAMSVHDPAGVVTQGETLIAAIFLTIQPQSYKPSKPPSHPVPFFSISNEIEIQLGGAVVPSTEPLNLEGPDVQRFLARSRVSLPVGWQAIEIYPLLEEESWDPQNAPMWAEVDILAHAAQRNLQEAQFNSLDARGETRKQYAALLAEFESLLSGLEKPLHQFLRRHPELISPSHAQMWSELRFGDRRSDFVFRQANNDYELVELEAPIRPLFRRDGQQREELTHAINQIADWIQYIEDNKGQVEEELGLVGISTSPRTLIIIGRSDALSDDDRRKLTTLQNQHPKLRILTYDDVLAASRAHLERVLGPMSIVLTGQDAQVYYFKEGA